MKMTFQPNKGTVVFDLKYGNIGQVCICIAIVNFLESAGQQLPVTKKNLSANV